MSTVSDIKLARLLQLASPALPVGAYSYSGGLESAIESGVVTDRDTASRWIGDVLYYSVGRMEAPIVLRLIDAWSANIYAGVDDWNAVFLASRETAELRAETLQMGYSLARLLRELHAVEFSAQSHLETMEEVSFPAAFAFAAARWQIEPEPALTAYLWAWAENQVMAAIKTLPLGQTDGQRVLLLLGERLVEVTQRALRMSDNELGGFAPSFAMLSSRHETQYSRLFRS